MDVVKGITVDGEFHENSFLITPGTDIGMGIRVSDDSQFSQLFGTSPSIDCLPLDILHSDFNASIKPEYRDRHVPVGVPIDEWITSRQCEALMGVPEWIESTVTGTFQEVIAESDSQTRFGTFHWIRGTDENAILYIFRKDTPHEIGWGIDCVLHLDGLRRRIASIRELLDDDGKQSLRLLVEQAIRTGYFSARSKFGTYAPIAKAGEAAKSGSSKGGSRTRFSSPEDKEAFDQVLKLVGGFKNTNAFKVELNKYKRANNIEGNRYGYEAVKKEAERRGLID